MFRQGDDRFQPVLLDDPLADVAFPVARVAGEQGRAVEDDCNAAASVLGGSHLVEHVLQKQQGSVVDARQSGSETAIKAVVFDFFFDVAFLLFPFDAEGWVGEHVVESPFFFLIVFVEAVGGEGVAQHDVVGGVAFDEHVRFANGPRFVVPVLTEQLGGGFVVELFDVAFGNTEHAAGSTGGVVDGFDDVAFAKIGFGGEQQVDHQADDFARREVFSGFFVGLFRTDPDEFFKDVAHLRFVDGVYREVEFGTGKGFDDFKQQVLLRHFGDLLVEGKTVQNVPNVL